MRATPLTALTLALSLGLTIAACSSSNDGASSSTGSAGHHAGSSGTAGGGGSNVDPPLRDSPPVPPVFMGSGGFAYAFGSAFPGAAAPQGMAKVGPDTSGPWGTINFLHYSGYWYGDDTVRGFSHMHLHGTGATDYGVLAFMPTDGFDATKVNADGYQSHFDKTTEIGTPGFYGVTLDKGNIKAEITATIHGAHHRYTYPAGASAASVVFDLDHHLSGGSVTDAEFELDTSKNLITGRLHSMGGMSGGFGGYDVYFAARTKAAWKDSQVWHDGMAPAAGTSAQGATVGLALSFDAPTEPVEVQVGISLVSADGALGNLTAELPNWDFDGTKAATAAAWATLTGKVKVTGGTQVQQDMLTGALYHAYLMPTIQSDTDGAYRGMDDHVGKVTGFNYVSDMSLWDTYRTLHPLYALITPDRDLDAVQSLHQKAKDGGFFPRWPIAFGEAGTMIGASAEIVLSDAYLKGIQGFDAEGAYSILRAAAMDPTAPPGGRGGRDHVESYMKYGYVPADETGGSVSHTTEYANDDLALAAFADALGHADDASALRTRAKGYKQLLDPANNLLWAKNSDGTWASSHADPTFFGPDYVEANAWQSMWMVASDIEKLAEAAGGKEKLIATLEQMFESAKADFAAIDFTQPLTYGAQRPYYWGANEPDINAPYVFAQLGRPDLTQKWAVWARETLYTPGADCLPGNDDGGTMSAWWIFSSLGFYPIVGTDKYIVGSPLFPHAEVEVPGGTFTVEAKGVSPENIYVQSAKLNGKTLDTAELGHTDLKPGGSLELVMGPHPSEWGQSK